MRLKGFNSIVTGGGKGIGRAITLALAEEGSNVFIVVKSDLESAEKTAKEAKLFGVQAIPFLADVSQKDHVNQMAQEALKLLGEIDLLVNNAGLGINGPLEEVPEEDWDLVIAVNLKGVFLCSVSIAKEMMKHGKGSIINIAGASAHRCFAEMGAFGPSKAAVVNLTKQMAVEWAKYNIRVNEVSPGPTMTPETKEVIMKDESNRERIAKIPMARICEPDEIARAVVFLASEESSAITGQSIIVDCGSVHSWYLYP